jgi:cytochrome o ubiquinol oxidase subunit 1
MPLYVLGFMGMTRRLSHYDNSAWHPYLLIAAAGSAIIVAGILLQVGQFVLSYKDRVKNRDLTGDPWDGRTLEWAVSSPPPFYNFAEVPVVTGRDALTTLKEQGGAPKTAVKYQDIHMPRNTAVGVYIGVLSLALGFALIWHIWWLAGVATLGTFAALIIRMFDADIDYYVPAAEVALIEQRHLARKTDENIDNNVATEVPAFADYNRLSEKQG